MSLPKGRGPLDDRCGAPGGLRALALAFVLTSAMSGCGGGRGVLALTVTSESRIDGVDHLTFLVFDRVRDRAAKPVTVQVPEQTIPPALELGLVFSADLRGSVEIGVEARDSRELVLARAVLTAAVTPGVRSDHLVVLAHSRSDGGADGGAAGDAAPVDGALADVAASQPDAAAVADGAPIDVAIARDLRQPDGAADAAASDAAPSPDLRSSDWTLVTSKLPMGCCFGVWVSSAGEIYVVGQGGLIMQSTDGGLSWKAQTSNTMVGLQDVWGSGPDDVYAVGGGCTILHSTNRGMSWSKAPPCSDNLQAVAGSGFSDVYAVGFDVGTGAGAIYHSTGNDLWMKQAATGRYFQGVAAVKDHAWVAGYDGLILHSFQGGAWSPQTMANPGKHLLGVFAASATDLVAVGAYEATLRSIDGKTWGVETMGANYNPAYQGVWGAGGEAWAVATTGRIAHRTINWSLETTPVAATLYGVSGTGPLDVYAVGTLNGAGVVLHRP